MTAGTIGSFPLSPLVQSSNTFRKDWSGTDGKVEVYNGFSRVKWNNYSCDLVGSSVGYPFFKVKKEFIPNPSGPGGTVIEDVGVSWNNGYFNFEDSQFYKPSYLPLSEALTDLLEKVKGHEFNLGVELGQARQTVGLLTNNLRKLGLAALALKRGNFSHAARQLGARPRRSRLSAKDISGRWLELQYGWLPLLSSSYEAMKAFEAISAGPRRILFRTSRSRSATFNLSTAPSSYSLLTQGQVRVALQYEMYEELSFTRQLGLEDPLSIAWELTPWSFVVDWFYPIGSYLSLMNQIPKLKGRWLVTKSLKVNASTVKGVYLVTNFGGPNWRGTVLQNPEFRYWMSKTNRTYLENPPEVPSPKFKRGLTLSRFKNALALAHQRFM